MVRPLQRLPGWTAGFVGVALLLAGVLPVLQAGHHGASPTQSIGMLAERLAIAQPALAQVAPAGPQSVAAQAPGPGFGPRSEYSFGLASKPLAASTGTVVVAQSGGFTLVAEGGATDTYSVVLTQQPTSDVSVAVGAGVPADLTHQLVFATSITTTATSTAYLTFTSANWSTAQTVTVSAVDDSAGEGRHTVVVSATVRSLSSDYSGVPVPTFTAEIQDNDAAVLITQTSGSTDAVEGGATDTYTVELTQQPTTTVTVVPGNVYSSQFTFSPASLEFTTSNYLVPQTVTVTATDDSSIEGYHTSLITHTITGYSYSNREAVAPIWFLGHINDNDSYVRITETGAGTTVREGGGITDTYSVYLLAAPTGSVSVTIASGLTTDASGTVTRVDDDLRFTTAATTTATSTVTLTFTTANYATAQTVYVTAFDDSLKERVEKSVITHSVRSFTDTGGGGGTVVDGTYNGMGANRVVVTVLDNDVGIGTLGADFDGDGKTDYAIFRPSTSQFFAKKSSDGATSVVTWGDASQSDRPVPADYDGDGKSDHAIYRPATAQFFVKKSSTGAAEVVTWGIAAGGDKPAVGDFDGDGKVDHAVYRPSTAQFFVKNSSDSSASVVTWGSAGSGDTPVVADYDGDGRADYSIYRKSTAQWYIKRSSDSATSVITWGERTTADVPVPGDYDGDGKADCAIWRPSTAMFIVRQSATTTAVVTTWGIAGASDVPVPGDYDGDGLMDKAVFRPSTANFIVQKSSTSTAIDTPVTWGIAGGSDYPLPVPDPNSDGTVYGFVGE
jgi:hypothetical protein